MTQRVVVSGSVLVFGVLAFMAHLLTTFEDKQFPVALGPTSRMILVFPEGVESEAAIRSLRGWAAETGLELVRVTADLDRDLRGKLFVPLDPRQRLPAVVDWYDDEPPARVVRPEVLARIPASGLYFVLGDPGGLSRLVTTLEEHGVSVTRQDPSVWDWLPALILVKGLFIASVAAFLLLTSIVLYWLVARAQSRALRVLGGIRVRTVQIHDLLRLLILIGGAWLASSVVLVVAIGLWKGWRYVPLFGTHLAILGSAMAALVGVAAVVMSSVSIPSPELIARRHPATLGARRAAAALKVVAFVFVLLTIGPAWVALSQAVGRAEQLSRWERLADEVVIDFRGGGSDPEADFRRITPAFGSAIQEADGAGRVALSWLVEDVPEAGEPWVSPALGPRWSAAAFVNQRWLDLVLSEEERRRLAVVQYGEVPSSFVSALDRAYSWKRSREPGARVFAGFRYLTPARGERVPLIGRGGDLVYRDDVLLIVVPGVWPTFNDSALLSLASQRSILFSGLDQTLGLIESHGLTETIGVQRVAEAGVLAAQFASFDARLSVVSMAVLALALAIAAGVSAYLVGLLRAKGDFARRLVGRPWLRVVQDRVVGDVALGLLLAIGIAAIQPPEQVGPVLVAAVGLVALSPVAHVLAARRTFVDVRDRRL